MIKVALGNVCSIHSGGTPNRSIDSYWGGDIPWAKISDLEASGDGYISDAEEHISEEGLEAIRGRIFDDGTLLFAIYGSVGKAAIVRGAVSTNQAILGIKPDSSCLDLSYLKFWLRSQQSKFNQDAQGVAQKNLSAGYVRALEIPLPPLPEQKRIAAILDKAHAIRRKRQQAIQLADDFLRAVFLDMFGDPVTNPKGWNVVELSTLVDPDDKLNYGVVQPGDHEEDGVPLVRSGDLSDVTPGVSQLRRVSASIDSKHRKSKLKGNEILIACVGTIGRVGWVSEAMIGWNIARAVTRIPIREGVNREYVYRYLQNPVVQGYFERETRAVAQPTLNVGLIAKTPVALPPHNLQIAFLERYRTIQAYKERLLVALGAQDELTGCLSQKAFAGQL